MTPQKLAVKIVRKLSESNQFATGEAFNALISVMEVLRETKEEIEYKLDYEELVDLMRRYQQDRTKTDDFAPPGIDVDLEL